jgi:hypothetical protein
MSDENKYHYITPEHKHEDGNVGRNVFTTDTMATRDRSVARETGLPFAEDRHVYTQNDHLIKGQDY